MTATATNPFDILPPNLFNVLSTQGHGNLQRHYMAILLRIYELAEFNRFGLTREIVIAEIVDYLKTVRPEEMPVIEAEAKQRWRAGLCRLDPAAAGGGRLAGARAEADYTEFIILPDYAFTLLEALRTIQEQKPREYTGQLYAAHQLLTNETDDFSPSLALTQAYENVRQVVRGFNELNQNIRRYTDRVTRDRPCPNCCACSTTIMPKFSGPAYHALKTSDHISRYRRDIVARLQTWQMDDNWLESHRRRTGPQGRRTPAQAVEEIGHIMRFIIHQLERLDPLLEEIDRRHAQYLRTSLRQIRYQLVSADGGFQRAAGRLWAAIWLPCWTKARAGCPTRCRPSRHPLAPAGRQQPLHAAAAPRALCAGAGHHAPARSRRCRCPARLDAARDRPDHHTGQDQRLCRALFNGHRRLHIRDLPADPVRRLALAHLHHRLRQPSRGRLRRRTAARRAGHGRARTGSNHSNWSRKRSGHRACG